MCPLTSALMACETLPDGEREKKVGVPSCLHGRRALSLTEGHTDPLHSSCRLCPGNHGNHPLPLSDPFLESPDIVREGTDHRYFRLREPHACASMFFSLLFTALSM